MGKARTWLQEERRKTLGDFVAFCVRCGYTQRYFEDSAAELPPTCPQCEGEVRSRCPSCGERFASAFVVDCERCGAEVRPREVLGVTIRKPGT